ncbi:MAG: hypothetical protein NC489_22530 [Ruminococcus flavefaciens]|nr:hypothetical protein [Ruminococcus flavefaciens]
MSKVSVVKEIIGKPLKKEGFEYAGYDSFWGWKFKREREGLTQWLYVCKGHFKELHIQIGIVRAGKDRIERYYGIENFYENIRESDRTSGYFNDETFKRALGRLLDLIYAYFLPAFDEISKDKYRNKWELTPEVYTRFHDEKKELIKTLSMHYKINNMTEDKLVLLLIRVLEDCKEKKLEEVEDILMGLAAFFGDYIVENLEECWWDWERVKNHEISDSRDYLVYYRKRYNQPHGTEIATLYTLRIIDEVWQKQDMNAIYMEYNFMFVERRKERKALSLWDREKEREMAGTKKDSDTLTATRYLLMPFIEQFGFRYDFYQNGKHGYLCYRGKEEDRQEIWLMQPPPTTEMWIKVVTKSGRKLEIQDIREGLAPYGRAEYCLSTRISKGGRYVQTINKLKEQIADIWIPVLENEEAYILQWELTPEMIRREFFDKEELLEKLNHSYEIANITKKELPEFIKRVLKENGDRSLEEFEDTLLGLGILLGETAIKEVEGSHWMWDKKRSACLIIYRNEVTGIDPAFALNYAWQRKKPENVDRLCQDLFEGNYIENRERGGYDIRKA